MREAAPIPTIDTAPLRPTRVLLWVREAGENGRGAWVKGYVIQDHTGKRVPVAGGYNGDWDIPYWAPLPADPE